MIHSWLFDVKWPKNCIYILLKQYGALKCLEKMDSIVMNQPLQMSSRVIADASFPVSLFMLLFLGEQFFLVLSEPMFLFP